MGMLFGVVSLVSSFIVLLVGLWSVLDGIIFNRFSDSHADGTLEYAAMGLNRSGVLWDGGIGPWDALDFRQNRSFVYSSGPSLDQPASADGKNRLLVSLVGVHAPCFSPL
jgi:hypothetical protein